MSLETGVQRNASTLLLIPTCMIPVISSSVLKLLQILMKVPPSMVQRYSLILLTASKKLAGKGFTFLSSDTSLYCLARTTSRVSS
jgi:hypothetical protein